MNPARPAYSSRKTARWCADELTDYDPADHHVEVAERRLREFISSLLSYIFVDEDWYRSQNKDVDDAILAGKFSCSKEHYIKAGYFEDRFPHEILVDEPWYLMTYTDVAEAVKKGVYSSAQAHFNSQGFREGRIPSSDWSLLADKSFPSAALLPGTGHPDSSPAALPSSPYPSKNAFTG